MVCFQVYTSPGDLLVQKLCNSEDHHFFVLTIGLNYLVERYARKTYPRYIYIYVYMATYPFAFLKCLVKLLNPAESGRMGLQASKQNRNMSQPILEIVIMQTIKVPFLKMKGETNFKGDICPDFCHSKRIGKIQLRYKVPRSSFDCNKIYSSALCCWLTSKRSRPPFWQDTRSDTSLRLQKTRHGFCCECVQNNAKNQMLLESFF